MNISKSKTNINFKTTILILLTLVLIIGCKSDNNVTNPDTPSGDPTVEKINNKPSSYVGKNVTMEGYLVAQIDDDDFWFKDESKGEIRVDFSEGDTPTVGEKIRISGRVQYDDGRLEIEVSSWNSLSTTAPPNFSFDKLVDIQSNPNSYLYQIVALAGTITSKADDDDDEFWFSDGTGEIKLDFPDNANYPSIGQSIIVAGTLTTDDGQLEVNVSYWE